ncbi:GDSL-type esterase/lipase family protein [Mucilaginibacter ginkgonis]|uniref:SGNH hydrolase-type esterase domain-containing protein n=1 Tax=Mucilaginibacter ginkgonis TaxID=2682091 RepID=A0A6I4IMZ6_9SPHI|nr:GDSL-type esterase/lipase family protein [Mucilaginibacter ginkgonis]QQL49830.1 hypothetical protein GO620_016945 [Mucilaginibacter ginkgonis]
MKFKFFLLALAISTLSAKAQTGFPFADELRAYKTADSLHFPKPGSNLFIGSSSIRMWTDIAARFPDKRVLARGVGGSTLEQWVKYYTPFILFPYKPERVFVYAGENDLNDGQTPQQVYNNFVKLYGMVQQQLSGSTIIWMSIKKSPSRAIRYARVDSTNTLVKNFIDTHKDAKYVDVNTVLYDKKTNLPDSSLFKPDLLHLKLEGYDRWQKALKKYVQ